jgi:hypothetical protein
MAAYAARCGQVLGLVVGKAVNFLVSKEGGKFLYMLTADSFLRKVKFRGFAVDVNELH